MIRMILAILGVTVALNVAAFAASVAEPSSDVPTLGGELNRPAVTITVTPTPTPSPSPTFDKPSLPPLPVEEEPDLTPTTTPSPTSTSTPTPSSSPSASPTPVCVPVAGHAKLGIAPHGIHLGWGHTGRVCIGPKKGAP